MDDCSVSEGAIAAQWALVARVVAITNARVIDEVEASGLPGPSFAALYLLRHCPGNRLPMNQIGRYLAMSTGGMTKLADRMGREGLIDRRSGSSDRRVVYAVLTEKGLSVAESSARQYEAAVRQHVVDIIAELGLEQMAEMVRPLDRDRGARLEDEGDSLPDDRDPGLPDRRRRPEPQVGPD